jgi:hypothetical protein
LLVDDDNDDDEWRAQLERLRARHDGRIAAERDMPAWIAAPPGADLPTLPTEAVTPRADAPALPPTSLRLVFSASRRPYVSCAAHSYRAGGC